MTSPRIVVFGATGFTGRLTVEALVAQGAHPVLAGRDAARLEALASSLPVELPTAVADVNRPATLRRLLQPGGVLISTVGPFARWGEPAVEAAIEAGAIYLDTTGEPTFIRRIFQRYGPAAAASGATLLTAFGYDYVPGNLAASLALRKAGPEAVRVDVGYFVQGNVSRRASRGTRASAVGMLLEPMYGFRDGRILREHGRTRIFFVNGRRRHGLSVGASEHFALPRTHSGLREVNVYLGWLGGLTKAAGVLARATPYVAVIPGAKRATDAVADRVIRSASRDPAPSSGGPTISSQVIAEAFDRAGRRLAAVELHGGDPYDYTGRLLAWAGVTAAAQGVSARGAVGPVEAFGLDALVEGCAEAGLREQV
ncbi:saccharopine dehydrogenase NADP-binding domain-containing protein [Sphaerisporangium sp. TRM90804]|uniref:saccharopine dehydrogenase family protein n=1 Tax=Sphaerisporangium sp. TRM90804 TaxID=3031113 RepID=UPI00244A998F|nr:saccharopine dehydrogenase NADP-binding domain-containing protein [Sphaerisporangium sp. TRM90804]MDH2425849.1 saccharopine dehydrogenase NADP-binding domain-containing protein [Sphaerisporangium sp. TRM90804]